MGGRADWRISEERGLSGGGCGLGLCYDCCRMRVPAFSAVTAAKEEGLNEQLSVLAAVVKSQSE